MILSRRPPARDDDGEPICPDCKRAGISQIVRLQRRGLSLICPECGGRLLAGRWFPAPRYPTGFDAWLALVSGGSAQPTEYPNIPADIAERWERLRMRARKHSA